MPPARQKVYDTGMGLGGRGSHRTTPLWLTMLLGVVLIGCSPVDRARFGFEALKVRWHRVTLADALGDEDLRADWRQKIETVDAVRRFAPDLGLDPGDAFATFTRLHLDHPGYVLTAAPHASLQSRMWWAPPLDAVPYKGFVELRRARDEASLLEHRGYDTHIRIASTFRSFGWLATPLLDQHLERDDVALVRLVLREIQRNSVALPGARAVAFNESFATFVAYRGTIAFFEERAPDSDLARGARVGWTAERRYGAYLGRLAASLDGAYRTAADEDTALTAKAHLLEAAQHDLDALSAHYEKLGIPRFLPPRNNAALLYHLHRTSGFDLFEAVHARTRDLQRTIDLISRAATAHPDAPYTAIRDTLADGEPIPPAQDLIPAEAPPHSNEADPTEDADDQGRNPERTPAP